MERSGARRRFAKKGGLKSRNADTYRKLYRGNQIFSKKKSLGFKSLLKETQEGKRSHHPRVKKLLDFRLLLGKEKSFCSPKTDSKNKKLLSFTKPPLFKDTFKTPRKNTPTWIQCLKNQSNRQRRRERPCRTRTSTSIIRYAFLLVIFRARSNDDEPIFELFLNSFGLLRVFFFLSLGGNKLAVATAFFFLARDGGGSNVERVSSSVNLTTLAPGVKTCIERATETKEEEDERRRKKEGDARFFFFFLELSYTVPADSFALVVCI